MDELSEEEEMELERNLHQLRHTRQQVEKRAKHATVQAKYRAKLALNRAPTRMDFAIVTLGVCFERSKRTPSTGSFGFCAKRSSRNSSQQISTRNRFAFVSAAWSRIAVRTLTNGAVPAHGSARTRLAWPRRWRPDDNRGHATPRAASTAALSAWSELGRRRQSFEHARKSLITRCHTVT